MPTTERFRLGRNYVAVGDVVHVRRIRPGRSNAAFDGVVRRIDVDDDGTVTAVHVYNPERLCEHAVTLDRVERRAQTGRPAAATRDRVANTGALTGHIKMAPPIRGRR